MKPLSSSIIFERGADASRSVIDVRPYPGSSATTCVRKCRRPLPWHHERVLRKLVVLMTFATVAVGAVGAVGPPRRRARRRTPAPTYEGTRRGVGAGRGVGLHGRDGGGRPRPDGRHVRRRDVRGPLRHGRLPRLDPHVLHRNAAPLHGARRRPRSAGPSTSSSARRTSSIRSAASTSASSSPTSISASRWSLTDDSAVDDLSAGLDAAVGALDTSGVGTFTLRPAGQGRRRTPRRAVRHRTRTRRTSTHAPPVAGRRRAHRSGGAVRRRRAAVPRVLQRRPLRGRGGGSIRSEATSPVPVGVDAFHAPGAAPEGDVGTG